MDVVHLKEFTTTKEDVQKGRFRNPQFKGTPMDPLRFLK